MGLKKFIAKKLSWPFKRINKEISEEIQERTELIVAKVLGEIDEASPVLTALLSGDKIEIVTSVQLRAVENQE